MSSTDRTALLVSNDFPPIGGAGVQRALYFAKYLPEFGWKPTVLTVRDVAFPTKDHSLLDRLPPEVELVRTESFELRRLLWIAKRLGSFLPGRKSGITSEQSGDLAVDRNASGQKSVSSFQRELGRSFRRWILVPDDRVLWAPFAIPAALRAVRQSGASAVIATTPPYTSGVIGALVARLARVPFLLDLRDPWTLDPYMPAPTPVHRWLNRRLESFAVRSAARVVVISEAMRAGFSNAYPDIEPDRIVTIHNGYDVATFESVTPLQRSNDDPPFVLAYVGSLYAHHRPALRAVCAAWSALAERNVEFSRSSRLDLIGRCDPEIMEELSAWPDVSSRVLGYLPHTEGLRHLIAGSALLLLIRNLDPQTDLITIPGKLFEYLGAGPPILMVGPEGDAADIVRESNGRVVSEGEHDAQVDALDALFNESGQTGNASRSPRRGDGEANFQSRFDRRHLTRLLAMELDQITNTRVRP